MVFKTVLWFIVFTKAFALRIVVMVHFCSFPITVAFNPKMVVGFPSQFTLAVAALQYPLRQRDRRWYARSIHFSNSQLRIFFNV